MIVSRVTALAALFAVLATASLTFAADRQAGAPATPGATDGTTIVHLERVVVTGTRSAAEGH